VLWRDPDTGRQTSLTYDDERDARVARELIEAAGGRADEAARIGEGVRRPGPTVLDAISEHIDLLTGVGADTRSHYQGQLRAHIAPVLGGLSVSAVTYRHVAGWVRAMAEKGLAPKKIANVHGLLSAAMTTAVRLGYRADNPCLGVEMPKSVATRDEMTVLTRDEFGLLLSKVSPHGEWSFIKTLRHLVFATDAWVRRAILGDPSPWDPLDLPWDEMPDTPGIPRDREVSPALDEVLTSRRDRMATVRTVIDGLTDQSPATHTEPVDGAGWPPPKSFPVRECLLIVLNEEWHHRLFAERDLDAREAKRPKGSPAGR